MNDYQSTLQKQYQQLDAQINSITLRDRALLLVALITVIYFLWEILLMSPQRKTIDMAKTQEVTLVKQLIESQQKIANIETQSLNATPTSNDIMITNSTVTSMFKSLLEKQQGIVLKGLYNHPNQPIDDTAAFKQKISMVFNGNYLSTHEYLRSVEGLKWMIFWDELQYTVTEYPNAEIKLTVYTIVG
ncbi:MAG: hypothetical protein WCH10_05730 [bacterium]